MEELNEKLLDAWVRVSLAVNNERVVSKMTYNESVICNILYRTQKAAPDKKITATDLCSRTKMLKSQMNRTLNSLEEKQMIIRRRSATDKRQVYIEFRLDKAELFMEQHKKILKLVDTFIEKFGNEKAMMMIEMFDSISDMAEEVI